MATVTVLYGPFWRLPVAVEVEALNIVRVKPHPGTPLLKCQEAAAKAVLKEASFSEEQDEFYLFQATLDTISFQVETDDLESVLRWNPDNLLYRLPEDPNPLKLREPELESALEVRAFLRSFIDDTGLECFESLEALETFFYFLVQYMMLYLLEKNLPVPLLWGKIYPAPLTPQWQAILGSQANQEDRFDSAVFHPDLRTFLSRPEKPGHKPEPKVEFRRPEIIWCKSWLETVKETEERRLASMGPRAYLKTINERMKQLIPTLYEALKQSRRERSSSFAVALPAVYREREVRNVFGNTRHRQWRGPKKRKPYQKRALVPVPAPYVPIAEPIPPVAVRSEEQGVPAVPAVG